MAGKRYDVLVVGGAGVDTVVRVDALPVPFADSVAVPPIREWAGHTGTGVALGCCALGLGVGFVDFVGDDWLGTMVRERLSGTGVDFIPLISPSGTRRAVNLVDEAGHRMSFYDARDPVALRMPREVYLPLLERSRHAHFSIMNFVRHLYDDAARLGLQVSTDLHDWDGVNEHHRDFALRSDLVFLSTAKIRGNFTEVMRAILDRGRARAVIATAGAAGCHLLTRESGEVTHIPAASPPRPVVDTNGAGDAFVSGFLYGHLSGRPAEECAVLGSLAGAHACGSEGTHASPIGREELTEGLARLR